MNNSSYKVTVADFDSMGGYRFVVIFARYKGKWLYSRKRGKSTFETQGGHIEAGESSLDAAKRELWEESGAVEYTISPAFDYDVKTSDEYSTGQVFFAEIDKLGPLPDFEMEEVKAFDCIPRDMTYPQILPVLYKKINAILSQNREEK